MITDNPREALARAAQDDVTMSGASRSQGLYMISVAASLAGVHPQTLRIYEQRHLIQPTRTPKGTRLYSDENVETLRRIQELTDEGMNLAGVQRVFDMEAQIARMAPADRSLEATARTDPRRGARRDRPHPPRQAAQRSSATRPPSRCASQSEARDRPEEKEA